jgi:SAM-dependent methyltransferase
MQSVSQMSVREEGGRNEVRPHRKRQSMGFVKLRCPLCGSDSVEVSYELLAREHPGIPCKSCPFALMQQEGIWRALSSDRRRYFAQFAREYEEVRKMEGRGSEGPEFYLALPYCDVTKRNSWQWDIRSRTYRYMARNVLRELARGGNSSPVILDLGAGNGWLSYRLACLGHRPIAVDLITNHWDGLGAAAHYRTALPALFPRVQAELDRLPFAEGQVDCAIFNASFHYSENYERTVAEAIRCLRPGGMIVIADSPTYTCEESGRKMVKERQELFQAKFGFKSDGMSSCEYLTRERLIALEAKFGIEWNTHRVWYGFHWAMRPWSAKLRRRREPSQFRIYTAQVKEQ